MLNDLASGRRLALRIVRGQVWVAWSLGLLFLWFGYRQAIAAAAGAAIVALGTFLASIRSFAGLAGAGVMMRRWLTGVLLRWMVILGGESVLLIQCKLPPVAVITGLIAAYMVHLLAFRF